MCNNQQSTITVHRAYKDRLFRHIFKDSQTLLNLYNAINGSDYQDPELLTVTTLEDVIFLNMKNDLSFIINHEMHLFEHQSTINPNMPLRGFLYFGTLYRNYVTKYNLDLFSSRLQQIPVPQFIIFYNGTKEVPDRFEMRLSDAFINLRDVDPALECTATVLNINQGHNSEIMNQCAELWGYSYLIAHIRYYLEEGELLDRAVDLAIDDSIAAGALADYLRMSRQEVKDMILTEYDEQKHIRNEKEISREEGRLEGLEEGRAKGLEEGLKEGRIIMLLEMVCNLLRSHSDLSMLTSSMGIDESTISRLQQFAADFAPDYNVDDVTAAWKMSR